MRVAILVYDTCAQFEVVLASLFIGRKHEIVTVGLDDRAVTSMEGFLLKPHMLLEDLAPDSIGAFIVPGGQPDTIKGNLILGKKLRSFNDRKVLIAAICGAPCHLGIAGLLKDRRFTSSVYEERPDDFPGGTYVDDDIVEDGNIITAHPNAYVDFALLLAKRLDAFKDQADYDETVRCFREFERC